MLYAKILFALVMIALPAWLVSDLGETKDAEGQRTLDDHLDLE